MNFISIFPNIRTVTGGKRMKLLTVLRHIQDGRWMELVAQVRATQDKKARTALKAQAPYFTVSGTFPGKRCDEGLEQHSGYIALDADKGPKNPDMDAVALKQAVSKDSFTYAAFTSIGGEGLCIIYKVPTEHHAASFKAMAAYFKAEYGVVVDSLGDPSRPRYISHDPELYLNESAATFEETIEEPEPQPTLKPQVVKVQYQPSHTYGQHKLRMASEKVLQAPDGSKHTTLNKMGFVLGGYVATGYILESDAVDCLMNAISARGNVESMEEAEKVIKRSIREGQSKPILPDEVQHIVHRKLEQGQPQEMIASTIAAADGVPRKVIEEQVKLLAEEEKNRIETFWHIAEDEKGKQKLILSRIQYKAFLEEAGFRKFRQGKAYATVRITNGIVEEVSRGQVKAFVLEYLYGLPVKFDNIYREQLLDEVMKQHRNFFDEGIMEFLSELPDAFVRDTKHQAFFFFQNCFVEVSATHTTTREYSALPGLIWAQQVLPRDYQTVGEDSITEGEFSQFLYNISAQDEKRMFTLMAAIGYLLHGYKSPSNPRIIVLVDQAISDNPSGGTGKGLVFQAIGHMLPVEPLDGKLFDFRDKFAFQGVTDATRLVVFEDWDGKRQPFDKLFNMATTMLKVNRLYLGQITIPYERSPKFGITTNDMIGGEGDSYARRKLEIEVAPHYSKDFKPSDEFGHDFFTDWNETEWSLFDNLMLHCCKSFLEAGLVSPAPINLNRRKLIQATSREFAEFCDELERGVELCPKELHEQYLTAYGLNPNRFNQAHFTKWLKDYARYEKLSVEVKKIRTAGACCTHIHIWLNNS